MRALASGRGRRERSGASHQILVWSYSYAMHRKPPLPGTLAALAERGQSAYVVCGNCGHFASKSLYDIACVVGWRSLVTEAAKRLRCNVCGHRGGMLTHERPRIGERVCPRCQRPLYSPIK